MGENKGFQGSERSGGGLIIYPQAHRDPVYIRSTGMFSPQNKHAYDNAGGSLVSLTTTKTLGECSGTFTAVIKPDKNSPNVLDTLVDDDWVDVIFYRHGKQWCVMRGVIESVRYTMSVNAKGATVTTYVITGREWSSIFEKSTVFFSTVTNDVMIGSISLDVFGSVMRVYGSPTKSVRGYLLGFLEKLGALGRSIYELPQSMGTTPGQTLPNSIIYDDSQFTNYPARLGINPNFMSADGSLWDLASTWSDPLFCELICDTVILYPTSVDDEVPPSQAEMQITFRDRPFPTIEPTLPTFGLAGPYFSLPTHEIPRTAIRSLDLVKSGFERFNAFLFSKQMLQESMRTDRQAQYPLWSSSDVKSHGFRQFEITSRYWTPTAGISLMTQAQRGQLANWNCLNPYLLSGTISLARGYPQIHIGQKVKILGQNGPMSDLTCYVENVKHSWTFGQTIKTELGVTRGWVGTDSSYLDALTQAMANYQVSSGVISTSPDLVDTGIGAV